MKITPKVLHRLSAVIVVGLFIGASVILFREFRGHQLSDVLGHLETFSVSQIFLGLMFAALGYASLVGYDVLALIHIRKRLPPGVVARTAFVSFAFSHNLGGALISGGSLRYRLYNAAGLTSAQIVSITLLTALTFTLGVVSITGIVLLLEPEETFGQVGISPAARHAAGFVFLALVAGWLTFVSLRRAPVRLFRFTLPLPTLAISLAQLGLAVVDIALAAAIVFVFLPGEPGVSYPVLLGAFVLASVAGVLSHVPGGLGVFETVLVLLLPQIPASGVLGAALAYRVVYYLLPLALAASLLAWHEFRHKAVPLQDRIAALERDFAPLLPPVVGAFAFVSGAVLLFSGALPTLETRAEDLDWLVPLPLVEISHLVGSAAGVGLLVLARGLFRKLNGAWLLAAVLAALGAVASLLKGLDYEEATILAVLLVTLLLARNAFRRQSALFEQRYNAKWIAAIAIVIAASFWLGLTSHKEVEYANDLWWRFSIDGHAPRFLRASVLVAVLAAAAAINYLIQPAPQAPGLPDEGEMNRARAIAQRSPNSIANAALAGDKHLMFSDAGDAMLMYGVSGQSWVALGDPVGPQAAAEDLAWRFRERSDRSGARTVFYQVGIEALPVYLDMGLSLTKLGEEAVVPLAEFSLAGGKRRSLRQAHNRALRMGLSFEVVAARDVSFLIDDLRRVSQSWLSEKHVSEKGFSIGRFDATYLQNFPCAIVRVDAEIVAFANLWPGAPGTELSVDLMRHGANAPQGVMDFMFCEMMLWGRQQGYRSFNMGMAPLSGLGERSLAPLWHRLGDFVFQHGEHFYNFEGLRTYKEKYSPEWRPKYLASPGGLVLPRVIFDVTRLIAGGAVAIIT